MTKRRLSSLDLLPSEAAPFVLEAHAAIRAGNKTDGDILFELNDKLATVGCDPISSSAFSRQAVKIKAALIKFKDAELLAKAVKADFKPEEMEERDIIFAEFIKLALFNLAQGDDLSPKDGMDLARGMLATVQARKISADIARKKKEEQAAIVEKAIVEVEKRSAGMNAATKDTLLAALRESIK